MCRWLLAAAVVALVLVGEARSVAAWSDGNMLFRWCSSTGKTHAGCVGYVTAIADVMADEPISEWSACIPANIGIDQLSEIVLQWLEQKDSEQRQAKAVNLVAKAFAESFPCE